MAYQPRMDIDVLVTRRNNNVGRDVSSNEKLAFQKRTDESNDRRIIRAHGIENKYKNSQNEKWKTARYTSINLDGVEVLSQALKSKCIIYRMPVNGGRYPDAMQNHIGGRESTAAYSIPVTLQSQKFISAEPFIFVTTSTASSNMFLNNRTRWRPDFTKEEEKDDDENVDHDAFRDDNDSDAGGKNEQHQRMKPAMRR